MTQALNRWLPSFTLACWSGILLYFHLSGRLAAFLHPTFRPGVLAAGLVLLVFAIGSLFGGSARCCRNGGGCAHVNPATGRGSMLGKLLTFIVLMLPLFMAFGSPRNGFGLTAISNRGVVTDASGIIAPPPQSVSSPYVEAPLPTNDPAPAGADSNAGAVDQYVPRTPSGAIAVSVIDLLYAAQDPSLRADFDGKVVELVGQLMAENTAAPDGSRMKVVRMFMTCCAADAKPVAALIEFPPGTKKSDVPELSWVRVNGIPAFPTEGGRTIAVLKVNSIKVTDPPDETMLF
jgi:uncharacterized repeat protein (TIGR03943 family)